MNYTASHKARASAAIRRIAKRHQIDATGKVYSVVKRCLDAGIVSTDLTKPMGKTRAKHFLWAWFETVKHEHPPRDKRKPKARPRGSGFYLSREWRELRYEILKKHGRRCMCCGATPDDGSTVLHVDHIKPRSLFPDLELDPDNLQVLCADCNIGKSNNDQVDYRTGQKERLT